MSTVNTWQIVSLQLWHGHVTTIFLSIDNIANRSPMKCPQLGPQNQPHKVASIASHHPPLQQFHQHANVRHHLLPKVHKQKKLKWMTRRPKIKRKRRKKRQVSISPSYSPTIDNVSCRTSKGALENTEDFAKWVVMFYFILFSFYWPKNYSTERTFQSE